MSNDIRNVKVVTHDGTFHADEVLAVAMIQMCSDFNMVDIVRTRNESKLAEALKDPSVIVIDVGGRYEPDLNNYDHHQDEALPCAASLIWRHFALKIPGVNKSMQKTIDQHFIKGVDLWDRGHYVGKKSYLQNTSQILGNFNRNKEDEISQFIQFRDAVGMASRMLENEIYNTSIFIESDKIWKKGIRSENQKIMYLPSHCRNWRARASTENVWVVVWPEENEYIVCSSDVHRHPLRLPQDMRPGSPDYAQILFMHPSNWIAKVRTQQVAEKIAVAST